MYILCSVNEWCVKRVKFIGKNNPVNPVGVLLCD